MRHGARTETVLELMHPLAELVPLPRLNLVRLHGVLASKAKLRPMVVPRGPLAQAQAATEAAVAPECEDQPPAGRRLPRPPRYHDAH